MYLFALQLAWIDVWGKVSHIISHALNFGLMLHSFSIGTPKGWTGICQCRTETERERERSVSLHACIIVAISLNHAEIIVGFNSFFTIWAFVLGFRICLCCPARITISLAMILTEATGTGIFGLPIFMVVVIATWVGPASLNCQVSPCKFKAQIERPTSKIKKLFNNREHEGGRGPGLKRISWWWEMMKTWCLSLSLPATVESGRRPGHELCKPC